MRDYIIINGLRSTLIKGLLITKLPPITKPQLRVQTDVIDGRDGDIVTPLGYAAYDKVVEIGLHGDYDVDEVIRYFSSSGAVIFSNEPTKYYNYQIISQIDYEQLIRYRTAKVTLHVQPFKYSAVETAINHKTISPVDIVKSAINKNGLSITASESEIKISGTATVETEIYIPVNTVTLSGGDHGLQCAVDGTGTAAVQFRLIKDTPTDENSFYESSIGLQDNETVTVYYNFSGTKHYNRVYFLIAPGVAINFTLALKLINEGAFYITNTGNYTAEPKFTIYGSGVITIKVNAAPQISITLSDDDHITIDTALKEAYKDIITNLKNRLVIGNYDNLFFKQGSNRIVTNGNITEIVIENYTRWL